MGNPVKEILSFAMEEASEEPPAKKAKKTTPDALKDIADKIETGVIRSNTKDWKLMAQAKQARDFLKQTADKLNLARRVTEPDEQHEEG